MTDPRPAPYPADTRAKGWRFELDYERIDQSDTWGLAAAKAFDGLPLARPLLLAMWYAAWKQTTCGSLPTDDKLIAAAIGIPLAIFEEYRDVLMRGWWLADDGRLYHDTIVTRVREMLEYRRKEAERRSRNRGKPDGVPPVSRGTDAGHTHDTTGAPDTGTGTGTTQQDKPVVEKAPRKRRAVAVVPPTIVAADVLIAAGFDGDTAAEFIAVKAQRDAPLTPRAWHDHCSEAAKAGWTPLQAAEKVMAKTWKGFEAKYVASEPRPAGAVIPINRQEAQEARNRAVGEAWLQETSDARG